MRSPRALAVAALLVSSAAAAGEPPAKFTRGPEARREADKVKIDFAVSAPTDVAVWVEDGAGKLARHIGAAKLGAKKVPEPFQPEKLEQSIVWDGKDDKGAPAPAGCRVKVALGLTAAFEEILGQDDRDIGPVMGLCAGRDGSLYVLAEDGGSANHAVRMLVLDRAGKHQRTLVPPPADLPLNRVEGLGAFKQPDGGWLPRVFYPSGRWFSPLTGYGSGGSGELIPLQTMAMDDQGVIYRVNRQGKPPQDVYHTGLCMIAADGGSPGKTTIGPVLSPSACKHHQLAISPDGKWLYLAGLLVGPNSYKMTPDHLVWRMPLNPLGKPEPFVGEKDKSGEDDRHLNGPTGLAVDSKGNIYVADSGNNRVAVFDPAGRKTGQLSVQSPQLVAVNPRTGQLYVLSTVSTTLARLARYDELTAAKSAAEIDVKCFRLPVMAADFGGERPVLWLGHSGEWDGFVLRRIEDQGAKFGDAVEVGKGAGVINFGSLGLDADTDDLYVRKAWYKWMVFRGGTGKGEEFKVPDHKGALVDVGPDGARWWLGRTLPGVNKMWEVGDKDSREGRIGLVRTGPDNKTHLPLPGGKAGLPVFPDNINSRGFCVGADGSVYAVQYIEKNHSAVHLVGLNPDGSPKKGDQGVLVNGLSPVACSPQVDRAGRIYVADTARPADQIVPERFRDNKVLLAKEGDVYNDGADYYPQTYGGILRFGPGGGSLEPVKSAAEAGKDPLVVMPGKYDEKGAVSYPGYAPGFVQYAARGCDLVIGGVSPVIRQSFHRVYCQCPHPQFKIDRFDRLFVPDAMGFEVRVHDSEGNLLTRFGSYGNADCKGPKSAKPKPEIPLAWGFSVMASDRFAYVGDNLNRRIVKVKLNYAEEKSCPAP